MQFITITSTEPVVTYLADTLTQHLEANEQVLWLVPGGSSIAIAAAVSQKLPREWLKNLTVTLTDERYGDIGHADSNWRQLEEAGFKLPGATMLPVLIGVDREATTSEYATMLDEELDLAHFRLGFFGIGPDGHTAGILPHSPAVTATQNAASYDAGNFQRVTMTPPAIARLSEAVVYAVGEAKWPVLEQLKGEMELAEQPAQALKVVPKLTVFTDKAGE